MQSYKRSYTPIYDCDRLAFWAPLRHLRRTISAILWRHTNDAKWRVVPHELGLWGMAARTFIRWAWLGVWERLLTLAQQQGVQLGISFLNGTNIRPSPGPSTRPCLAEPLASLAQQKTAGAEKSGHCGAT